MTSSNILEKITQWSSEGNIRYKKHAFIRIVERKIEVAEVEEALQHAEIIKRYPEDIPLGSILLEDFVIGIYKCGKTYTYCCGSRSRPLVYMDHYGL